MKNIKRIMNMSDKMKQRQCRLQQKFKNIEQQRQQNWKIQSSYGKSINYIAESPLLRSKLNQIAKYNKQTKKEIFHCCFKQAANSLEEGTDAQELFTAGDETISSV